MQYVTMVTKISYLMNEASKLDNFANYAFRKAKIRLFFEKKAMGNHDNCSSNINNSKHSCDIDINNNHKGVSY
jgi:hypothetical protein